MRKILLATTALVGVAIGTAGVAHAAAPASPITVNVGGYVDFIAGFSHESQGALDSVSSVPFDAFGSESAIDISEGQRISHDFETEFKLNIDAMGKAANGIQYGANIGLWNGPEVGNLWTGGGNTVELNSAYVWLSGAFGKALFGDEHGASDLFVYAPTVGEGQVDGRYMDFVSPFTLARVQASGIDNTEHSTKITYYTPKVGNDDHKVQLGVSYAPQMYDYGSDVTKTNTPSASFLLSSNLWNGVNSPYQDVIEGALQYTGNFHPVSVTASAQIITGSAQNTNSGTNPGLFLFAPAASGIVSAENTKFQDFTAWGLGAQVAWNGWTFGGSYNDLGSYGAVHGQNRNQEVWSLGGKYEMDKVTVGVSWLNAEGYNNLLAGATTAATTNGTNYVQGFNAYGAGATYNWFPGLTSAIDGILFTQSANQAQHNDGYVVLLSQKLTF